MKLHYFKEDDLKEIGEEIAEIVRQHGLQFSPEKCSELFTYMIGVVEDWNSAPRTKYQK